MSVKIFQHRDFRGTHSELSVGQHPNFRSFAIGNDSASSLRVPHGLQVTLYQHNNFGGSSRTYVKDTVMLDGFNDTVSSAVVSYRPELFPKHDRYYKITVRHSGKVLDISGHSKKDGAIVHQWDYHGGDNQLFKFVPTDNGYYKIISKNSGKALEVADGSTNRATQIRQNTYTGAPHQNWRLEPLPNGSFKIIARHSAQVMDIWQQGKQNGAKLIQWADNGGANQQFELKPIAIGKPVLHFDGQNDVVVAPLNVSETGYTCSIWFKTLQDNCGLFSVEGGQDGSTGHDRHIYLRGGNLHARVWQNETIATTGVDYADGLWHCVTHVVGGQTGQRLYVDGKVVAQGTKTKSDFGWQDGIMLGYSADGGYFKGEIASLAVWSVALSESQAGQWNTHLTGNESGLQLYWDFSEGSGSRLKDRTKHQHTGTIRGNPKWGKSADFTGAFIPSIIPADLKKVEETAESLYKAARITKAAIPVLPDPDTPKRQLATLVREGLMPQFDLYERLKAAIDPNGHLVLSPELLGDYSFLLDTLHDLLDMYVRVENAQIKFVKGEPGMLGTPGREIDGDPKTSRKLATPTDHAVQLMGDFRLFSGLDLRLYPASFYHYKGLPHCSFTLMKPGDDPAKLDEAGDIGLNTIFPDVPIINGMYLSGAKFIACTSNTVYDPVLDSGINTGLNFFGNVKFKDSKSKEFQFIGDLFGIKEIALHGAADFSPFFNKYYSVSLGSDKEQDETKKKEDARKKSEDNKKKASAFMPEFILEVALQRQNLVLIDTDVIKLEFTRSDLGVKIAGKPPEPSVAVSSDMVLTLQDTPLIFTGGIKLEPESVTGFFTMNGTGRAADGKLSGENQNVEWKDPLGIPGITVRQLGAQLGFTYAGTGLDNLGLHGNMKIGDVDGSVSILLDANDPDQFVLAGATERITMLEIMSAMTPVTFVAFQALPSSVKRTLNKIVKVHLENVKVNIVPSVTSIGNIHFRDEGVTVQGRLDVWGWESSIFINVDTFDGLTVRGDMDPINVLDVFKISGARGETSPSLSVKISPSEQHARVSARVELLMLSTEVFMEAKDGRLEFSLNQAVGNMLTTDLRCSYSDYNLRASGKINFNLNLDVWTPFGNINMVNVQFGASATLGVGRSDGFLLELSGYFHFYGHQLGFPSLKIHIAPASFEALFNLVVKRIRDEAGKIFKAAFATLTEWANAVKNGVIKFAGVVADVAKNVYGAGKEAAVQAYKTLNKTATDIARGMKNTYRQTKEQVAQLLKGAGYAAEEVAAALKGAYNLGERAVAAALKYAGYGINEVGNALKSVYGLGAAGVGVALRYAGYGVTEVGHFIKGAYGLAGEGLNAALRGAGYAAEETGKFMIGIGEHVGSWVIGAGGTVVDTAKDVGGAIGGAVSDVGGAIGDVFGW